jgi:hypothetical protein
LAINDTYFFTAQGTFAGRVYAHTLHFRELVGPITGNPAQDLINTWQTSCQTAWLAAHPSAYTLVRLTAQRICGSLPLPSRVEEGVGLPGTRTAGVTGDPLPSWLSICCNESTGLAGKSRHGRFFMSGGFEGDINGEALVVGASGWLGVVQAYVTALTTRFVNQAVPLNWELVVHSRQLAEDNPTWQCTQTSEPVTAIGVVARLTTQRSRRA